VVAVELVNFLKKTWSKIWICELYCFTLYGNQNTNTMENQENKLRVKLSQFKSDLTFNEWVLKYNVGRQYHEPTKYFQGNNPKFNMEPIGVCKHLHEGEFERFFRVLFNKIQRKFSH
jgi:hypothetical protein